MDRFEPGCEEYTESLSVDWAEFAEIDEYAASYFDVDWLHDYADGRDMQAIVDALAGRTSLTGTRLLTAWVKAREEYAAKWSEEHQDEIRQYRNNI